MTDTATLEPLEDDAWRAFNAAHGRVVRELDHNLTASHHVSLAEYEVLMHLREADGTRLRMNELAELCGLSPSGLTRRFDSMVRSGLVEREKCDDDRRGVFACITPDGMGRLSAAAPIYTEGVKRAFVAALDPGELDTVTVACERIAPAVVTHVPDSSMASVAAPRARPLRRVPHLRFLG